MNVAQTWRLTSLMVLLSSVSPATVTAQEVSSVTAMRPTAKLVEVFAHDGDVHPTVVGTLLRLGPDAATLLVNGQERELPLTEVARIETPRDGLKNGAIIGAIVLGSWCAIICGQGLDSGGQLSAAIVANAALGASIGVGFDALVGGRKTIYQQRARQAAALGFAFSWRF